VRQKIPEVRRKTVSFLAKISNKETENHITVTKPVPFRES